MPFSKLRTPPVLVLALLAGGCGGSGSDQDKTLKLLSDADALMRSVSACVDASVAMRSMQQLAHAQVSLAKAAPNVDGRTFILDPTRLPATIYIEDPSAPRPASTFRFLLYREGTTDPVAAPLENVGFVNITRGSGVGIQAHVEAGGTVLDYAGGGTIAFATPGDRRSRKTAHSLTGNGTCSTGGATTAIDFSDTFTGTLDYASLHHQEHAKNGDGELFFQSSSGYAIMYSDSDHSGQIRLLLATDTILVDIDGIRGYVAPTTITVNGDATVLTTSTCPSTSQPGSSVDCLMYRGKALDSAIAQDFMTHLKAICGWTISSQPDALFTPVEAGLTAPGG